MRDEPRRFERTLRIRFSHCDPAGIVFFPQYLLLFNALVEDWFTDGLCISYAGLIDSRRIGLPTVKLECEFKAVSRMGDDVSLSLVLERLGARSMTLRLECTDGGRQRVGARQVLVFTDLDTHRAIPIPSDVRLALT